MATKAQKKKSPKKAPKRGKTTRKATGKTVSRKASKKKVAKTTRTKAGKKAKKKATSTGRRTKAPKKGSKRTGSASKPASKRFKSATLVEQSHQIYCEAQMLRSVVSALSGSSSRPMSVEDRARRNALSESFCLHFRTLLDFLWEGRAGKKEAVARDFFATPRRWKPAKPKDYRDLKKRLAKEINALTTTRYSDLEIEEWPYRRIFDEIFVDIDRFQSTAPAENLHGCWRERPIAAVSADGARSSTVAGTGPGDAPKPEVESDAAQPGFAERDFNEPEAARPAPAVAAGSLFSGPESLRPAWSSTTGDEEEQDQEERDEAQTEESKEPVFTRGFSLLGSDED